MPATWEAKSPTGERNESNFFAGEQPEMQRLKSPTNGEYRSDSSTDSGNSSPTLTLPTMRRVRSTSGSLKRPKTDPSLSQGNLSEQTHLLFQKMMVLEQKLKSMESQLKDEQLQRLTLEAKVVKLEEDNQKLIARRETAGQQLQDFAEKFFAASDAISIKGSPAPSPRPSPYPSLSDLNVLMRRGSRAESVSSSRSSQSRLSGISL